jgi:hypothetical protein
MSKVRVHMMASLDGYVAGPNRSVDKPFGQGTEHFLDWLFRLRSFRQLQGMEGGETGPSDDVIREAAENVGATIMGRNMFGGGARLFENLGDARPRLELLRAVATPEVTHLKYRLVKPAS